MLLSWRRPARDRKFTSVIGAVCSTCSRKGAIDYWWHLLSRKGICPSRLVSKMMWGAFIVIGLCSREQARPSTISMPSQATIASCAARHLSVMAEFSLVLWRGIANTGVFTEIHRTFPCHITVIEQACPPKHKAVCKRCTSRAGFNVT